jgi:hypothetical protein
MEPAASERPTWALLMERCYLRSCWISSGLLEVALPYAKFPDWYGVSASTGERGLTELREHSLLHREQHRRPDTESPVGFSDVYHYELFPPFGPRNALSKSAPPFWSGPSRAKVSRKRRSTNRSAKTSGKTATPGRTRSRGSE